MLPVIKKKEKIKIACFILKGEVSDKNYFKYNLFISISINPMQSVMFCYSFYDPFQFQRTITGRSQKRNFRLISTLHSRWCRTVYIYYFRSQLSNISFAVMFVTGTSAWNYREIIVCFSWEFVSLYRCVIHIPTFKPIENDIFIFRIHTSRKLEE